MINLNIHKIIDVYSLILKIRYSEDLLAQKKKEGFIKSPIHLSAGQEAVAVSIGNCHKKGDIFFGNHRSHHHILALGTNLTNFFAEILCKKKGLSKGYGASMHLVDKTRGFFGSVPIVTGSLSLATGAAFALKKKRKKNIAIAYFGDGATEEGVFHESLLFSSKLKLPLLYVIENNEYSSNVHISQRQVSSNLTRFAFAHGIKSLCLDGNNFPYIYPKIQKIIFNMRKTNQPFLIEAKTYRYYGHVDWREDIDVGIERSKSQLVYWKMKDPIKIFEKFLLNKKIVNIKQINLLKNRIKNKVLKSWDKAFNFKDQKKSDLLKFVYHD
jgi:TPP-dependent pyruvate/acetoin dehydrogenase alpha subunit